MLALPADIKSFGLEFEDSGSVCLSLSHRHACLLVPPVKMWTCTLFAPSCPELNCEAKLLRFHIWSIQAKCYTMSMQTVMLTLVLPAWKHAELEIVLLAVTVLRLLCLCKNLETVYDPGWSFHVLSAFAGFLTNSKDMYIRLIWGSELPLSSSPTWGNHPSLMLSTIVDDLKSKSSHGWRCRRQATLDKSQDCFSYISYYCNYSYMLMLARPLVLCLVN